MKNFWLALVALSVLSACSSRYKFEPGSRVTKNDVVIGANWIKDKGDKYDMQFTIANNSTKSIVILLGDMSCYRGELQGQLKHTFFNTGERTIDFRPGELKMFNLVCNYGMDTKGPFKITIKKVYDNPRNDGSSTGAVLAENLNWVAKEK